MHSVTSCTGTAKTMHSDPNPIFVPISKTVEKLARKSCLFHQVLNIAIQPRNLLRSCSRHEIIRAFRSANITYRLDFDCCPHRKMVAKNELNGKQDALLTSGFFEPPEFTTKALKDLRKVLIFFHKTNFLCKKRRNDFFCNTFCEKFAPFSS